MDIIKIIREAYIHTVDRCDTYTRIAQECGCSRSKAKELMYSFLYQATNDYLNNLLSDKEV